MHKHYLPIPPIRLKVTVQVLNWSQKRHAYQLLLLVLVRSLLAPPSPDLRAGHQQLVKHEARNANGIHHSEDIGHDLRIPVSVGGAVHAVVCLEVQMLALLSVVRIHVHTAAHETQVI